LRAKSPIARMCLKPSSSVGKATQDIIKVEDIKDSQGDVVGKRIYSNEGVKRYDIDDDGNIMWERGGMNPRAAVKVQYSTEPVRHRIPPHQKKLDCSRPAAACRKGGTAIVSASVNPL